MALADRLAQNKATTMGTESKNKLFDDIANARTGSRRKKLLPGTGIYIVNGVKFEETSGANGPKYHIDKVSLTCLSGLRDGSGLLPGEEGYDGPVPGDDYEWVIFRDGKNAKPADDYVKLVTVFGNFLVETKGCHAPLTDGEIKALKENPAEMMDLIQRAIGFEFDGSWVNGEVTASELSGLGIAEIKVTKSVQNKKVNGEEVFDKEGKNIKVTFDNVYWNRQVSLEEAIKAVGNDDVFTRYVGGETVLSSLAAII